MLDPGVAQTIENFNETVNSRLDYSKLEIPGMGTFALEEEVYNLPQRDPVYGHNTPCAEEYGPEMETVPLTGSDDVEPEAINKYIEANGIIDKVTKSGGNLAAVKRRVICLRSLD